MTDIKPLRVLVVDDAVFYRKIISDILGELPGVEVVGTASNGKIAMSRIASLKPDLVTLDVEMPEMDGLDVLSKINEQGLDVGAIMLSAYTRRGSETTIKALELGAFDFIPKPDCGSMDGSRRAVSGLLATMIKAFVRRREIKSILKGTGAGPAEGGGSDRQEREDELQCPAIPLDAPSGLRPEVVAIGISTGGPNALARMLPQLPADLGVPVLIVQHMPAFFTQSLASSLNAKCPLDVREAADGDKLVPNLVLIAPGGKQMKIVRGVGKDKVIRITDDPPENSCKPSADYLFKSVAYVFKGRAAGVIMTGMGSDGTLGLKLMKRFGAGIIAQDEASCVVYGMPKGPVEAGIVDIVAPLDQIAAQICRMVRS